MVGTVVTTLIILIASVVLGAGVIFFGGSLFQTLVNEIDTQIGTVVEKVSEGGNTRCVVELNNSTRYIVRNHICIEAIGAPMNVTMIQYETPENEVLYTR